MKFVNLNKLGKWLVTMTVILSFMFGSLVENKFQVVQNVQGAVENIHTATLPSGNKIKERFDAYYKEAEKTYNAIKIGTVISMAILISSLPKQKNRGP
ncbi:hypothetical protein [Desulforamulus aeronauticus]|uniref:Uncharacterized protein n=1 Tax=Desulforamulus aeronauticus DSM 10349 TaxID=1121421 RepID=A0A1M6RIW3_9FIRM|nr:hypothetical protein [Desulforamulus aeronauticus]SHK32369.1 hypothetical protein SAMN02745123_01463 [Desulforamulus aeronauticus DSM 10349]